MQVSYRSRRPKRAVLDLPAVYEQVGDPTFCCEGMARQWGRIVAFGVAGHPRTTSREVCLSVPRPQASGGSILEVVAIDFCPWCGEAVEVCRVKWNRATGMNK